MKNSLEFSAEEFFVQLLRTHPVLKKKQHRHADDRRLGETNCLIYEAEQGNHRLDGPKGFDVTVTVVYRAPATATPQQNDQVAGAMTEAVFGAQRSTTTAEKDFGYLLILDEMGGTRSNTKSLRRREKVFNLIARLKDVPENALSR